MLALAPKVKMYPVLLPESAAGIRRARIGPRRHRLAPATRLLLVAACLVVPAIVYVHQAAAAARTGYAILSLREDIRALRIDNARLVAAVIALRSPERIERIAVRDLGMRPPRGEQLASLGIARTAATARPARLTWRQQLSGFLLGREAAASETR
jgi:cell division protein FtsL